MPRRVYTTLAERIEAFRRTDVRIRFGKPIYLKELPPEQRKFSGAYVQSVILDMLRDMKQA